MCNKKALRVFLAVWGTGVWHSSVLRVRERCVLFRKTADEHYAKIIDSDFVKTSVTWYEDQLEGGTELFFPLFSHFYCQACM